MKTPAPPTRLSHWLVVAGLLVLPLVLYAGAIDHPFLIDDHDAIAAHPDVVKVGGLATLWGQDYWAGRTEDANLYRPITVLSYWLNWRVTPDTPAGFRVVNLLLLGGIGVALFVLLKRHAGPLAASLAAALFIAHPVHGEAINHIVGRADLLAVLGIVGFLALQQHALHTGWTTRRVALAALLTIVALGSKESGFVLVPLALLQWWMGSEKGSRNLFPGAKKVPDTFISDGPNRCGTHLGICRKRALLYALLLPLAAAVVARVLIVGVGADYAPGSDDLTANPLRGLGFGDRLPESMGIYVWYLKQMVWPSLTFNQTPAPGGIALGQWATVEVLGAILFFATIVAGLVLSRKRRVMALAAALLLFHFLVIGNLLLPTGVYAANRLTVATTAAAALALGLGLGALFKLGYRTKLATTLAAAAALLLASAVTFMHQPDWSSELARMQADAAAQPDNPIALYWVGQAHLQNDEPARALPALEKAVALRPASVQAALGLANAALYAGKDRQAWKLYYNLPSKDYFNNPYALDPATRLNAAMAAFNVGEYEQAELLAQSLPADQARDILNAIEQVRAIRGASPDELE